MLVAQRYPQVVILIQKHFLHPCLSDAACLIPREEMPPQNSPIPLRFLTGKSLQSSADICSQEDFTAGSGPSAGVRSISGVLHRHWHSAVSRAGGDPEF